MWLQCISAIAPVSCDESFLDTIPMVHVQVKVQHPGMVLQQLKDSQDQVIDVAKSCEVNKAVARLHVKVGQYIANYPGSICCTRLRCDRVKLTG